VGGSVGFLSAAPFALASLASLACGLTADYSGLQGGTRFGPEAGTATDASGLGDARADAGFPADAGDAGDAGPSFCASLATPVKLCTDFDEGPPVETGWFATDVYGGAAISLTTNAFSAPGALLSTVNPSGAPSSARLEETVPTQSPSVHVEFELLLVPSDGTFELAAVHEVTSDGTTYGLFYREVASALQVQLRTLKADGSVFDQTWPIGAPPASWVRVDLDLNVADTGSFTVTQDGNVVASQTNVPTSTGKRTAMFVELGLYTFVPGTAQASFDDAIVDWP
jgi:hypothetical protein